jgi:hypothetical protein
VTKRNLYAAHAIGYYWIALAEERTLEAFALSDDRWVLLGAYDETATARIEPFTQVELAVGRLFLPPATPPPSG